jgi:hypothetical protein
MMLSGNQNDIHDETKSELNAVHACYHSVKNLSSFSVLSKSTQINLKRVTSAFWDQPRRMLRIIQRFGKHSSCHLQGDCIVTGKNNQPTKKRTKDRVKRRRETSSLARHEKHCWQW